MFQKSKEDEIIVEDKNDSSIVSKEEKRKIKEKMNFIMMETA
jgi:hypothetical protein